METLNTLFGLIDIQNQTVTIQILVFLSTTLLLYGVFLWLTSGDQDIKRRLREIQEGTGLTSRETHKEGTFQVRWIQPIGDIILPKDDWTQSQVKKKLVRAGFRSERAIRTYYGLKILLAVLLPVLIIVPLIIIGTIPVIEQTTAIASLVIVAIVGYYLPSLYLYSRAKARREEFSEGFPDAMDMLVVCVEAGLGLDAAIQRVGKEMALSHPELAIEFNILSLELRAGKGRAEALRALAERTDVDQVKNLVALLIQAEHFGTSIATALRDHASEMRLMRIQFAKEKAAKLPVKMLFPIIFFIFPALFIVVLSPAVLRIYIAIIGGTVN
ncbi:MAG: type II secretion system F family protein [Gammaproteobacteria bacterium]|nr:type II secretion system F family protein [Gammaproteobacteria bacterium]MCW8972844.1 type II secretion system F family protein [Gammaproteobacteria bacterium]MCW8992083.1 type II secretion system F family protein [Gammaproteobacteria bacterium]